MRLPLLLLLVFSLHYMIAQPLYKNLVFEGGGVRGLAYAGAIKALDEKGVLSSIERTAGTSAGSIAALLISVGYNSNEIDSIMRGLNIEKFNDGGGMFIGGLNRMKNEYGYYKGVAFEKWVGKLIEQKTGNDSLTFHELHQLHNTDSHTFKDFYCTGTNITSQRIEIFSFAATPDLPLKTAVRISCAIPLYYEPVCLDSSGRIAKKKIPGYQYQIYVDGGMMANYPITIFDTCYHNGNPLACDSLKYNHETLGIKLERPEQIEQLKQSTDIPSYKIQSFSDYSAAFLNLMIETLNRRTNLQHEKDRTIYVSDGNFPARVRKMKAEEKDLLFLNGKNAVGNFFQQRESIPVANHLK
jgi:NTE family protein